MFRRKTTDVSPEPEPQPADAAAGTAETPEAAETAETAEADASEADEPRRPRGYTPSKKELGRTTPKRPSATVRRPNTNPDPRARRKLSKEERQALREERRERRREISDGMRRGDPQFLAPRDRGPERKLARDVVDSRRTVGTWFFAGALIVLLGSSAAMPEPVRMVANLLWATLALAVIADSVLICRKIKKLLRERFPKTDVKPGSLYLYAVMRGLTFRRIRIPAPQKSFGDQV